MIQCCKLLHLLGIPSAGSGTAAIFVISFSLPFIRHISLMQQQMTTTESPPFGIDSQTLTTTSPSTNNNHMLSTLLPWYECLFYFITSTLACYWSRTHITPPFLRFLLGREATMLQELSATLAVYSAYLSVLLLVFAKQWKMLRRFVVVVIGLVNGCGGDLVILLPSLILR